MFVELSEECLRDSKNEFESAMCLSHRSFTNEPLFELLKFYSIHGDIELKQYVERVIIPKVITKTCLYIKCHFYIVKLGFTGVYIIFLNSAQKHRLWVLIRTASLRQF